MPKKRDRIPLYLTAERFSEQHKYTWLLGLSRTILHRSVHNIKISFSEIDFSVVDTIIVRG